MENVIKLLAFASLFFYILCWFTDQPTKELHYVGIVLPWLSLIVSIPVAYVCNVKDENYFEAWGYVYAVATIVYVVVVSLISGSILSQLPHLAACVTFIAYFSLEVANKQ